MEVLFTVMGTPRSVELPMLSISSLSEKLNSTESENRMINGNVVLLSNTRKRVGFFDVLLSQKSKESSSVRAHESIAKALRNILRSKINRFALLTMRSCSGKIGLKTATACWQKELYPD